MCDIRQQGSLSSYPYFVQHVVAPGDLPEKKRWGRLLEILKRTLKRYQDSILWVWLVICHPIEVPILKQYIILWQSYFFQRSQDYIMQNFIAFGRRPQVTCCYVAEIWGSISQRQENHILTYFFSYIIREDPSTLSLCSNPFQAQTFVDFMPYSCA